MFFASICSAILAAYGYDTAAGAVQSQGALECVKVLMSFLPAAVALISLLFMVLYPLNKNKMEHIQNYLIIIEKTIIHETNHINAMCCPGDHISYGTDKDYYSKY